MKRPSTRLASGFAAAVAAASAVSLLLLLPAAATAFVPAPGAAAGLYHHKVGILLKSGTPASRTGNRGGVSCHYTRQKDLIDPRESGTADDDDELRRWQQQQQQQQQVFDPLELSANEDAGSVVVEKTTLYPEDFRASDIASSSQEANDNQVLGIWAARALLLLVAGIWGTNFAAAFMRFGVAAVVSAPLLFRQRWDVIAAGLECGCWIALGYVSQALALSSISSGKCAFICSLTVVVVPILSAVLYGKPVKPMSIVAAVVALTGVGVLEGMVDFNDLLGIKPALADPGATVAAATAAASSSIETASVAGPLGSLAKTLGVGRGDIIALGQPIGFGYTFLRIEQYQEKFKDVPNRVLTIAAAQCVAVGILSLFWVLHDYNWSLPDFTYMLEPHRLAAIGWTGIVTTVMAIFLEGIALQTASATDAALAFSSEPVWAGLFGFLLLREKLGTNSYIGGAIILTACLLGAFSDVEVGKEGQEDPLDEHPQ